MSQIAQENATAIAAIKPLGMLGTQAVYFNFPECTHCAETVIETLKNVPQGALMATIAIKTFDAFYSNHKEYGFGQLTVSMDMGSLTGASCTIGLRDSRNDGRVWSGSATGIVTFYGE
jgi:copper chaperone CopZ